MSETSEETGQPLEKELVYPSDCVEATTPVFCKRKQLGCADVPRVEAWRILMALKSGLLAESTWALDILNILLFEDSTVACFDLSELPGFLEILIEHMKKAVSDILAQPSLSLDRASLWPLPHHPVIRKVDIEEVASPLDSHNRISLLSGPNYSFQSRTEELVYIDPKGDDVLVTDEKRCWDNQKRVEESVEPDRSFIVPAIRSELRSMIPSVPLKDFIKIKKEEPDDEMEWYQLVKVKQEDEEKTPEGLGIRDPAGVLKRKRVSDDEEECYIKDEASLCLVGEYKDALSRRCVCLSTALRNLTFVPENEIEFAKNVGFLRLVGKLLLLDHEHLPKIKKDYDQEEDMNSIEPCTSLHRDEEWFPDFLDHLRENTLVSFANIAGQVNLDLYPEDVARPILDGLLHWAVCPSAQGQDPFPTVSTTCSLSPQRLALEALSKLCATGSNTDLVTATPPYCRLEKFVSILADLLSCNEEQVLREFAVNLLYYLAAADSRLARTIALQPMSIPMIVRFIEEAELNAMIIETIYGIGALWGNPDGMGTSLDLLKKAAKTLHHLSEHPDNRDLFRLHEESLLALMTSQSLDQQVVAIIARVMFQVSQCEKPMTVHHRI